MILFLQAVFAAFPAAAFAAESTSGFSAASYAAENTSAQTANAVPQTPELASIKSTSYRLVTISWKKAEGASRYYIYYKPVGAPKWKRIAIVDSSMLSYTHLSSAAYPIVTGTEYVYTVRAFNAATKKYSSYDKKGLSVRPVPNLVPLKSAAWNSAKTAVTVTWGKAVGGNYYRIYRKSSPSGKWTKIAMVGPKTFSYVDKEADRDSDNYYTVRLYDSKTKTYGKFSKAGVKAVSASVYERNETAALLKKTATARKTSQIILVVDHNLSFWEKGADGSWTRKLSAYCGYGKNGMSDDRHEGDKTTPIGSFPILHAFGIASNPGTTMQYRKITRNSYWSGEYSTYNQWVESPRHVEGEHLIDYYQYKYAMAIGFNRNPTVYKKGAAIFLHCKSYDHWHTAGCVGVEEKVMKKLLLMSHNGVYMIIVPNRADIASY